MEQLSIMIDLGRCIGCKTCIVACRNGKEIIDHVEAVPNALPYYLRVETKEHGRYPDLSLDTWVVPCQHCPDPGCLSACPHGAIAKDPQTGVVHIDPEKCTGCEFKAELGVENKTVPSPCKVSCPAGLNVQGYVQLVKEGKYEEAVKLILRRVPLPGVLGRVCPHPCEDVCRRAEVDQAVSIRELKRAAADAVDFATLEIPKIKENGIKIAVIGSGPAGLTAAYNLRLKGYSVTIFEALDVLGGMLRVGIPDYRLPNEVVDREIDYLLRHGIEARTGVRFGEDMTLESLAGEGYAAVLLGIGLQGGMNMNVPGNGTEGVLDAIRFLREVNLGDRKQVNARSVVVGGGNVAIDAARAAKRLGCADVTVVYRRTENEMPAYAEELAGAKQEGIAFVELAAPVEVVDNNGKVSGLKCIRCELGMPDESGRPRPVPIKGSEFVIECDTVIPAIGQSMDATWTSGKPELAITAKGTFHVSSQMQTTLPHVFAAGDAARGPATVIHAIADGHRAAEAIDRFAQGLPVAPALAETQLAAPEDYVWKAVPSGSCVSAPRQSAAYMDPEERSTCFLEECHGLGEDQVNAEAKRCLNCGCACMQSCPYDVIQFDGKAGISHKCNLCSERVTTGHDPVCVEVCMTDALTFGEHELLKQEALDKGREIVPELSKAAHIYVK
ncbi:MAG: FAD-dependent oxidoreductase [Deltaproteobacteria bacterium]|nr:FAD-dependent oxidoreductase [Deltaproteobacteria bacterium]